MKDVKLIILDVDGTLTDGVIHYDESGREHKHFHVADGLGIVMGQAIGLHFAVVSGRTSAATTKRMQELRVRDVLQGVGNKAAIVEGLMSQYGLLPEETAFVGDDVNDIPAFNSVGVRIAVADASELLRARAGYVTIRPGGHGAVREVIEEILRRQGKLDAAVSAYLNEISDQEAPTTA